MDINCFIDNDVKKKIEILDYLRNIEGYKNGIEIAHELSIDRKTSYKYLEELLIFAEEQKVSSLLDYVKGKGYRVNENHTKEYLFLKKKMVESCFPIIFLIKLLSKDESLTNLIEKYHISEAFINKKMCEMRKNLEEYSLTIVYKKGFFSIEGPENEIRFFYFNFLWTIYRGSEWKYAGISQDELLKSLNHYIEKLNIPVSGNGRLQIAYFLAINIIRYSRKKEISTDFFNTEYNALFTLIGKETGLQKYWFTKINKSKIESNYFLAFLSTRVTFTLKYKDLYLENNNHIEHTQAWLATQEVITYFDKNICPLDSDKKDEFKKYLYSINLYADFFYDKKDHLGFFLNSSTEKYLIRTTNIFKEMCEKLYIKTGYSLFEKVEYLVNQYSLALAKVEDLTFLEPQISVLVDTDMPYSETKIFLRELSNITTLHFNVVLCDRYKDIQLEQKYDLLVTTTDINYSLVEPKLKYEYIAYVDSSVSLKDYRQLDLILLEIYESKLKEI